MTELGKILIGLGGLLVIVGVVCWGIGRLGIRMPGDLAFEGERVRVYFPIATCVVLSILLTVVLSLWRWLSGK